MYDVRGLQGCVGSSVEPNTGNVPSQGGLFAGGMNPMLMQQQYGRVPPPPPQMSVQDVMQYASGMNQAQVVALAQFFQEQLRQRSSGRGELFWSGCHSGGRTVCSRVCSSGTSFAVRGSARKWRCSYW